MKKINIYDIIIIPPQGEGGEDVNKDREEAKKYLKTAKGQIEGILKMIDEGRYCIDISNQIVAAEKQIKKANMLILKGHLNSCVKDAFLNDGGEEKVDEVIEIFDRLTR